MGKILFIDSDDIQSLSEALQNALEKRGVRFNSNGSAKISRRDSDDDWLFQESGGVRYNSGGCGGGGCGCRSGSYCGGSTYTPHYGGCGGGGYYPRC